MKKVCSHCGKQYDAAAKLLLSRFSRVRLCATPRTAAHQAPLSTGSSKQEYWSGLPFPSPHYPPEFAQARLHWMGDALQPSHPLSLSLFACGFFAINLN